MNIRNLALVLAVSALTQACVQANAEIPNMEVTRQDVALQPAPFSTKANTEATLVQQFKYEKTPSPLPTSITAHMHATEVTFTLKKGAPDLSFIHAAKLTVTEPGGKPQTVLDYKGGDAAFGSSVTLPVLASPPALNPWEVDASTFELSVTGILPQTEWFLDVTLGYTGSVSYSP